MQEKKSNRKWVLSALAVGALLLVVGVVYPKYFGENDLEPVEGFFGLTPETLVQAPDFTLLDQNNSVVSLSDYPGRYVILAFIFTHCVDTCPLISTFLRHVSEELGSDYPSQVQFLSITVDPKRDSPEALAAYMQQFKLTWPHLTGSQEVLEVVWAAYNLQVETEQQADEGRHGGSHEEDEDYEVGHNTFTYLLDRQHRMRVLWPGDQWTADQLLHDVRLLRSMETEA